MLSGYAVKVWRAWQLVCHTRPFGSRVLLTSGTNVILAALALATGILAARLLGPEGRGALAAIQTWPTVLAGVAMLGLPDALVYFSAREPDKAGRYLASAIAITLLASLPFMIVGYSAMPLLLAAQLPKDIAAARWYLLLIPIFAVVCMPYHPLRGRNDLAVWNSLRTMPSLGWLVVLAGAWVFDRPQPESIAAAYLALMAMLFFPVSRTVARRIPGPFSVDPKHWKPMLRFGLPSMLSSMPQALNLRLDQMLMAGFLPARTLGLYVVAVAWSSAVYPLLSAVGAVLFPQIASQSGHDKQASVFAQGARFGVLLSLTTGIGLMALTPWGVPLLFGMKFAAALPAAFLLVVAATTGGLNMILEEGFRGLGYPGAVVKAECGGLIVTTVSLLVLLRPLEIMGAAMASLLGCLAVTSALVIQARRYTGYPSVAFLCPSMAEIRSGWHLVRALVGVIAKRSSDVHI